MKLYFKILADRRIRRIIYTGISALGSKGINLIVVLISVPLTYNYLGDERFGMLMTMLSILAIMGFADLGLGLGLLNKIAIYESNTTKLKSAISSTFFFLIGISTLLSIIFLIPSYYIDWHIVFNVHSSLAKSEVNQMVFVFITIFLLVLPFTIISKVQGGFQEGYYNEIWLAAGNITSLLTLYITVHYKLGVPYILLSLYGVKSIFVFLNFAFYFFLNRKDLIPKFKYFDKFIFKAVFSESIIFFILQILAVMNTSSDNLIIAQYKGAQAVALFSIGYRLFTVFMMPVQAFIYPLLPAFNDALAKQETKWIINILRKISIYGTALSLISAIIYMTLGNKIISIWINKNTVLPTSLIIAFSVYVLYFNVNGVVSQIMMTPKLINKKLIYFGASSIFILLSKIFLIKYFNISIVLWITIVIAITLYIIPSIFIINKEIK